MRKFAPAQISYQDDFLILYPSYMITGSFYISLFEGVQFMWIKYEWCKIANIKHGLPILVDRQTDFRPQRVVVSRLDDTVVRFCTAVKFSPCCNNQGELMLKWFVPAWWYHVNKCRAMRGNRSELASGRKLPQCHVNMHPLRVYTKENCGRFVK